MNNKKYIYGLLALLVIAGGTIIFLFDRKVQIVAATTVFKEQQWQVQLSERLHEDSIARGEVYVTRADGNKISVPIELGEEGRSLTIKGLKVGEYALYVGEKAFERKSLFTKQQKVPFKVIEKLEKVTSEKELRDYFEALLAQQDESESKLDWGLGQSSSDESAMDTAAVGSNNDRHSTTNNQVEGIEEGDMTVTDGRHIFTLQEERVVILNVEQPGAAKVVHKLQLQNNAYPSQLMLHENYLLVVYDAYEETEKKGYYDSKSFVKTAIYDVTNAENPQLVREIGQEGHQVGVRKDGNILYVVSMQSPNYYMMREDQGVDLVPAVYDSIAGDEAKTLPVERISILPNSSEPSYLLVSALDLANATKSPMTTESFLGSSNQLYMSEQAIYVTAAQYERMMPSASESNSERAMVDIAWFGRVKSTQVYKFAIDGLDVSFAGQASVPGQLLNQFSMDEYNNYFRIATTQYENNLSESSTNGIYIYDQQLNEVGNVTGLAPGERIYSARFMGDKAYVVTFKEVDPLFVIDVANPAAPKVLGELKIPGFSNYLHPISETHLLGIGYDTVVKTDQFSKQPFIETRGMKVALFDVSDLANPKEQDAVIIGGRGTYSEIQHNHKALFRDVENSLYGFPVNIYEESGQYESKFVGYGAQIYKVTMENGIELAGDLVNYDIGQLQYEDWDKSVQRIIYVGDTVYTVARGELKSYRYPNFEQLQQLPF